MQIQAQQVFLIILVIAALVIATNSYKSFMNVNTKKEYCCGRRKEG